MAYSLLRSGALKPHFYNSVQGSPELRDFHQLYCESSKSALLHFFTNILMCPELKHISSQSRHKLQHVLFGFHVRNQLKVVYNCEGEKEGHVVLKAVVCICVFCTFCGAWLSGLGLIVSTGLWVWFQPLPATSYISPEGPYWLVNVWDWVNVALLQCNKAFRGQINETLRRTLYKKKFLAQINLNTQWHAVHTL